MIFGTQISLQKVLQTSPFKNIKSRLSVFIIVKAPPDIYSRVPLFQFYSTFYMILLLCRFILLQPHVLCFSRYRTLSLSAALLRCGQ